MGYQLSTTKYSLKTLILDKSKSSVSNSFDLLYIILGSWSIVDKIFVVGAQWVPEI